MSDVDRFIAVSEFYAPPMSRRLGIPRDRIAVVPLGVNLKGFERRQPSADGVFRVGYLARIAPEKGLQFLADAYREFRQRTRGRAARLEVAGYLAREHQGYLDGVRTSLDAAGLAHEFTYHGAVDRDAKLAFLR